MRNSLGRRLFQVLVSILALNAILVSGLYLLMGLKGISFTGVNLPFDPSSDSWSSVDYLFRALSGTWLALGLMLAYLVPSIERQTVWFRFVCAGIFLMGLGRLLSVLSLGANSKPLVAMALELILPPLLVLWQGKLRVYPKTFGAGS